MRHVRDVLRLPFDKCCAAAQVAAVQHDGAAEWMPDQRPMR